MSASYSSFEQLSSSRAPVEWSLHGALLSRFRFYVRPAVVVLAAASCFMLMMKAPETGHTKSSHIAASPEIQMLNENVRLLTQSMDILHQGLAGFKAGMEQSARDQQTRFALLDDRLARAEAAERSSAQHIQELNGKLDALRQTQASLMDLEKKVSQLQQVPLASLSSTPSPSSDTAPALAPVVTVLPPVRPSSLSLVHAYSPTQQWRVVGMADGFALIESAHGVMEVQTGSMIPGIGRVEAIMKKGRNWVVVTRRGVIGSSPYWASRNSESNWSKQGR
jgi:hypothetical protein